MMRPLFTVLSELIVLAEHVVTRPAHGAAPQLGRLADEVRRADARPAEGVRTTRAALVMVIALEEFVGGDRGAEPTARWLMIAGAMLPLLRGDAYAALCNEREARAETA
jgi:hypothetical protein